MPWRAWRAPRGTADFLPRKDMKKIGGILNKAHKREKLFLPTSSRKRSQKKGEENADDQPRKPDDPLESSQRPETETALSIFKREG